MGEILLVGNDAVLIATRAAVLSKTGAKVVSCAADSPDHVRSRDVAVVILCHTLDNETSEKFTSAASRYWPKARLIRLLQGMGNYPAVSCESNIVTLDGPSQLLDQVRERLGPSASNSTGDQPRLRRRSGISLLLD